MAAHKCTARLGLLLTPCAVLCRIGMGRPASFGRRRQGAVARYSGIVTGALKVNACQREDRGLGQGFLGGALVELVQVDLREHTESGQAKSVVTR